MSYISIEVSYIIIEVSYIIIEMSSFNFRGALISHVELVPTEVSRDVESSVFEQI